MRNLVLGDDDRLWLGNFLDNLLLHSDWIAKLCPAIWASICSDFNLPIWIGMRSRYAFMPYLLAGLSHFTFILLSFVIAATSQARRSMWILIFG